MITPRPYQAEAVRAVLDHWRGGGRAGLVVLPTGTGKSVVAAMILRALREDAELCQSLWGVDAARAVCFAHVAELIRQNHAEIREIWPGAPAGAFSASVGRRDVAHPITFAQIQSIWRRPGVLGPRHVGLIDEAHLVPHRAEGMYRQTLSHFCNETDDFRLAGLTATPYRMGTGRLDESWREHAPIFDKVVFEQPLRWFVEEGYLAPVRARWTGVELDVSGVAMRGGEFVQGQLERAVDHDEINRAAVAEICAAGRDRRAWMVFAAGVGHARHLADLLADEGVSVAVVTGDTPLAERARTIDSYRRGELRALVSVNTLTTGFNVRHVDLIACLRPTGSAGLLTQMVGRGTRTAEGKTDCLWLDFAGNLERHGPVDQIDGKKKPGAGGGDPPVKKCPTVGCQLLVPTATRVCPGCGHQFPAPQPTLQAKPSTAAVMSGEPDWRRVIGAAPKPRQTAAGPWAICVSFDLEGLGRPVRTFLNFDHPNPAARYPTVRTWRALGGSAPEPKTTRDAWARVKAGELRTPGRVRLERRGRYWEAVEFELGGEAEMAEAA